MMRLILPAMMLFPAAASACESMAAMHGAPGGCASGHGCGAMSLVLMAAISALGVWVLRSVEKDGVAVKRTGQIVGWTLAVVGLGGFLCGAVNYGGKKKTESCHMNSGASAESVSSDTKLPPGHPPIAPSKK